MPSIAADPPTYDDLAPDREILTALRERAALRPGTIARLISEQLDGWSTNRATVRLHRFDRGETETLPWAFYSCLLEVLADAIPGDDRSPYHLAYADRDAALQRVSLARFQAQLAQQEAELAEAEAAVERLRDGLKMMRNVERQTIESLRASEQLVAEFR